jgi:hypothetical protein
VPVFVFGLYCHRRRPRKDPFLLLARDSAAALVFLSLLAELVPASVSAELTHPVPSRSGPRSFPSVAVRVSESSAADPFSVSSLGARHRF